MQREHKPYTIRDLVHGFLEYAEAEYPSREPKNLAATLSRLVAMFGDTPADEFRAKRLTEWRDAFARGDFSRRPPSRPYINKATENVRRAFAWAVSLELVDPATLESLRAVRGVRRGRNGVREPEPVRPIDVETVLATIPALPGPIAGIVELLRLTGARTGEIRTMRAGEIDTARDDVWIYRPGSHKSAHHGRDRVIPLDEPCQRVLVPRLRPFIPASFVFESPRGGCYGETAVRNAVRRACDRLGIPPWHPHQIRHTALTAVRRSSGDLDAAQGLAGHANRSTTERYAQNDTEAAIRGLALLRDAVGD
jgi:integrase